MVRHAVGRYVGRAAHTRPYATGEDDAQPSPRQLPSGRHGLPRSFVLRNQRERMLAAVVEVVGQVGYASMTVSDVISRAGVSRRTFYEHFANKEDVFLAAYDHVVDLVLKDVGAAYDRGETWIDQVGLGLEAFVTQLARQPALAHVCVVEVLAAGPKALARRSAAMDRFRAFIMPGYEQDVAGRVRAPNVAADAVIGGIYEVIYAHVLRGETARLPALAPELLESMLIPFVGVEGASQASLSAGDGRG
jgi:AcrR family transcriptional regulator